MKQRLQALTDTALDELKRRQLIAADKDCPTRVEPARGAAHGDFSSNIALLLAGAAGMNPRELAGRIVEQLPADDSIDKIEIAGPGFINFFLKKSAFLAVIKDILDQREQFGDCELGQGQKVLLEFVSANPTGPLHVGHGRAAAYGAACAGLLRKAGFAVHCEYYVNDAGRQMDILTVSILLRYLQLFKPELHFPPNGYQGDYIKTIASELREAHGNRLNKGREVLNVDMVAEAMGLLKEEMMDSLIKHSKEELGEEDYRLILEKGLDWVLREIKTDLAAFGVEYDEWFSERDLLRGGRIEACIDKLEQNGHVYSKDGARWFRSKKLGDVKDRVLVRENGETTYFASDIAYHRAKIERGFDRLINIWGADHHGYIARVKAAMRALGLHADKLEIRLVQFVSLYRGQEKLPMSTRSGEFVTLKQLQDETGKDAARFFYILRKAGQHLDFDLELAKSHSNDNPVYYIQYAHARICSVFRQAAEKGYDYKPTAAVANLAALTGEHEMALARGLARYPDLIAKAAGACEPHQLAYYLLDLANDFHRCYNASRFLAGDEPTRNARLALADATGEVIRNGLAILGVNAPERM